MAEKQGTPLAGLPGFPVEVLAVLAAYWIVTCEDLAGAAADAGGLAGLARATGQSEEQIIQLAGLALAALPPAVSFAPGNLRPHGLGALDEREPGEEQEEPPSYSPLPPGVDLRSGFGPVRNQGQRGTCVAHAGAALREYLLGQQPPGLEFSEQYHYWDCKQHDLIPNLPGTYIKTSMARLHESGICPEAAWPYNPDPVPGNESQGPAPQAAEAGAAPYRIAASTRLVPTDVAGLCLALSRGKPVVFSVPVYDYWFTEPVHSTGDVRLPLPGEPSAGGHAMCMAGYQLDESTPGGGWFIVRNSWGEEWAGNSAIAPGYARVPFAYINLYASSAFTAAAGLPPAEPEGWWERLRDRLRRFFAG